MASPFSLFRKNQRAMMVVIGVGCMVGFLLGGMGIIEGIQPGMGGGPQADSVVVSWKGGELTENDIDRLRLRRGITVNYLAAIAQQAIENGGSPKGPGVIVDQQGRISQVGISQDTSDRALVYSALLAEKAEEMGLTVTDEDVAQFIRQVSDESISNNELNNILQRVAGDNLTDVQLFESLRHELLAARLQTLGGTSALTFTTPGEVWQYFNRVNRRIEAEVVPLEVSEFTAKVPTPSTSQLRAFFEKHKRQFAHPLSPEPGFRIRQQLAFGYFQADINSFMEGPEGELAKVTEEQIKEYYEENKDTSFRERALPSFDEQTLGAEPPATPPADTEAPVGETPLTPPANSETPAAETPASETPAAETPADTPATPAPTEPAEEPAANEESPAAEPAPEEPAAPQPPADDEATPATEDDAINPPADDAPAAEAPADDATSARRSIAPGGARFVSYLLQDEAADEPAITEAEINPAEAPAADDAAPAQEPAPPAADTPAEEPAPAETPEAPAADPATPATPEPAPETEPAPEQDPAAEPKPPAEEPTTEEPAAPATQPTADPKLETPAAEPQEVKYTPLEKVSDEIRRSIAQPKAFERMQKALKSAEELLVPHATLYRQIEALSNYKDNKETAKQVAELQKEFEASRPNYEKIARDLGLTYGEIPLVNQFEVQNYPLGQVTIFDRNTFQQIPFAAIAYGDSAPLYKLQTIGGGTGRDEQFLYWSHDAQEPRVPEFSEVYDEAKKSGEVLEAWKMQQALPLAQAKAKELAEEANKAQKPLSELFAQREDLTVLKTNQFSWLTTGGMPFGFGQLQFSQVASVDHPGAEFMQTAFSLEVGETGTAVNQPQTVVYVVRVTDQSPSPEALRAQFAAAQSGGGREQQMAQMAIMQVARADYTDTFQDWNSDIEREMGVEWMK